MSNKRLDDLLYYGRHSETCPTRFDSMYKPKPICDCGFDEAIESAKTEQPDIAAEDKEFEREIANCRDGNYSDLRHYAGVISGRLRQMDKRARKANARANELEVEKAQLLAALKGAREALRYMVLEQEREGFGVEMPDIAKAKESLTAINAVLGEVKGELLTVPQGGEEKRNECDCLRRPDSEGIPTGLKPVSPTNNQSDECRALIAIVEETCVGPRLSINGVEIWSWLGTNANERAHWMAKTINDATQASRAQYKAELVKALEAEKIQGGYYDSAQYPELDRNQRLINDMLDSAIAIINGGAKS